MLPSFLRPERVPYASITIVRETPRAEFHALITHPTTGSRLDAMLADCQAVDAAIAAPLVTVCAWCMPTHDPMASQGAPVSHGICPSCAATFEADDDRDHEDQGDACGAGCGYCGRCS